MFSVRCWGKKEKGSEQTTIEGCETENSRSDYQTRRVTSRSKGEATKKKVRIDEK
jgi:hypothetical protein